MNDTKSDNLDVFGKFIVTRANNTDAEKIERMEDGDSNSTGFGTPDR